MHEESSSMHNRNYSAILATLQINLQGSENGRVVTIASMQIPRYHGTHDTMRREYTSFLTTLNLELFSIS